MGQPTHPVVHNFQASLALSHEYEDAPWWEVVYRQAFPGFASMLSVRGDGWWQRCGIDRVVTLENSRQVLIDEKVRTQDYPDILLEVWSNEAQGTPGWVEKAQACDYIAYAFVPSQRCFLLPFLPLRRAWRKNRSHWIATYREVRATNDGYVTVSVAIPIPVLMNAVRNALVVSWATQE